MFAVPETVGEFIQAGAYAYQGYQTGQSIYHTAKSGRERMSGLRDRITSALTSGGHAKRKRMSAGEAAKKRHEQMYGKPGYTRTSGFYKYGSGNHLASRANELKFFDTTITHTVNSTMAIPGTGGQLNLIPQGTTESSRIGRNTVIHSLELKGEYAMTSGTGVNSSVQYLLIVQDKQCNGTAAGVLDVMTSAAGARGLINLSNSKRFHVLRKIVLPITGGSGVLNNYAGTLDYIHYFKKLNIPVEFASTTGAIGEIASNNLFILMGCDGNSSTFTTFAGIARIRFSD